jgi:hypothetical protein
MATKATWVIGCACLLASASTLSSESLLAVMRSCAAQADESARLQCFDRGVAQFKGAADDAGSTSCSGTGISPKQVTARIVTLSHRPGGMIVVSLDNDQTWEQTEDGPNLHISTGDSVKVERGLLGAYWLSPVPGHLAVKVRRTQ